MPRKTPAGPAGSADGATRFVAYYRVSTESQGRSGLGLDAQRVSVDSYVTAAGGQVIHEFTDIESGKRSDRPQLAAAVAACRQQRATLIVAKIDRLSRNAAFLLTVAEGLKNDAGGVVFCDLPQLPPGPMGLFFLTVMAAIAQLERGFISDRTKAALAAVKARGRKLGNPRLRSAGAGAARKRQARGKAREIAPYITAARKAGCETLEEICQALTARGVRTPSGKTEWGPEQVRRVERYMERFSE
jgi:DNA invertase Pin-like site-specific DNA recombinase